MWGRQLSFDLPDIRIKRPREIGPGAVHLPRFAEPNVGELIKAIQKVLLRSPFRQMSTPGGKPMSAELSSCGAYGWVSDVNGYRYMSFDPFTGDRWPAIPAMFASLAAHAAAEAGYPGFNPDTCLINRYVPGAKMSLHQDSNERDFSAPIVSVSLGLPAVFLWGGAARSDRAERIGVEHGDVVVFGGPSRMNFHGVARIAPGEHPLLGACRVNLTFRKAK